MLVVCPYCGAHVPFPPERCERCTAPLREARIAAPLEPEYDPPSIDDTPEIALHPMSLAKLYVMSVVTLGLYNIYWFYRNWVLRRDARGRDVMPPLRAIFAHLVAFSLFEDVEDEAVKVRHPAWWSAGWLAFTYFVQGILARVDALLWPSVLLAPVVLLVVQRTINETNARARRPAALNEEFSPLNIGGIVVGCLCIGLLLLVTLFPEL